MERQAGAETEAIVKIASAQAQEPFDCGVLPLDVERVMKVAGWDATSEFGDRSLRVDETTLAFVAAKTLVRVEIFPPALASEPLDVCARIAARLED